MSKPSANTEAFLAVEQFLSQDAAAYISFGVSPPRFLLLSGPPGVGKTYAARNVALQLNLEFHEIAPGAQAFQTLSDVITRSSVKKKRGTVPTSDRSAEKKVVIFLDEIDEICPSSSSARTTTTVTTQMLCQFLDDTSENLNIFIIGATNRPSAVNSRLLRAGRLDRHVVLKTPDKGERLHVLKSLCTKDSVEHKDLETIATKFTHGYVTSDLVNLVHRCSEEEIRIKSNENVGMNQEQTNVDRRKTFYELLKTHSSNIVPSTLRNSITTSVCVIPPSNLSWDDIIGGTEAKRRLKIAVQWPFVFTQTYKRLGLDESVGRGILLHGPPGCAKTSLVRIAASVARLPFLRLTSADVFSSYVGDSERIIRDAFTAARSCAPCILFMDEIDAIAAKRTNGHASVGERVLAALLTEMDGVQGGLQGILVIGATNRIDAIDNAMLRPGRFDDIIQVELPNDSERAEIINVTIDQDKVKLASDVSLDYLVQKTNGWSGADIKRMCAEAMMSSVRAFVASEKRNEDLIVCKRHFEVL